MASFRLVCLALLLGAISSASPAATHPANRLTFWMETDPSKVFGELAVDGMRTVYVSGPIADGDTARFLLLVRQKKLDAARLIFNSPGGSLLEGVKLGRAIRQHRFFTYVGSRGDNLDKSDAVCASACAYAFAGGVSRFLSEISGKLGIHQFRSAKGMSEGQAQLVSGMLVSYLREMGVDPEAFAVASSTNSTGITWLTSKQAEQLGFANNGVKPTTAEIKVLQMHPYLRLNQDQSDITIRVLFDCENKSLIMQAGIVSDPQQSADIAEASWQKRSYVEINGREAFVVNGADGAKADDSTIWVTRPLTRADAQVVAQADDISVWVDGFGAVRFGGTIDLRDAHPAVTNYFQQCLN